ncbi:MAG TPA: biopolymer transporter ExbD [Verrucomicrobiales bacterium]|jgi:biopolymer transport protein ExbD|nr:biopolymer transporter ExbD [Verrucomicrobiales bacterium]
MRRTHEKHQDAEIGFQIAPMIDVVFVIMLFFMVLAGDRQVETELKMTLPSTESREEASSTPMEEQIAITVDGEISHNDEPVSKQELKANFTRLGLQAKADGAGGEPAPIVVTISPEPDTPWEKVTDVMNAMSAAGITNVTFSVSEEL